MLFGHYLLLFILFELILLYIYLIDFSHYDLDGAPNSGFLVLHAGINFILLIFTWIFSDSLYDILNRFLAHFNYGFIRVGNLLSSNLDGYNSFDIFHLLWGIFGLTIYLLGIILSVFGWVFIFILNIQLWILNILKRFYTWLNFFKHTPQQIDKSFEQILGLSYQQLESCIKNRPDCGLTLDETEVVMRALLICQACKCSPNLETLEHYQEMAHDNRLESRLSLSTMHCEPELMFSETQLKLYRNLYIKLHTMRLC